MTNYFACLQPATVETFEAQVRMRFKKYLRKACESIRYSRTDGAPRQEYLCIAGESLGVLSGQVSVLYDLNVPYAYAYLKAYRNVYNAYSRERDKLS